MTIPTIEELEAALNQRRNELLGSDAKYCYLAGQLQLLQAQKEQDAGDDTEGE